MGTVLSRLEFKQNFDRYQQGLFIVLNAKRLPKDLQAIHVGQKLSEMLCDTEKEERRQKAPGLLEDTIKDHKAISLTHIEILFTDYLEMDVVRTILGFCRNRKICCLWPGQWSNAKLIYATPEFPEYYECDIKQLNDLYIISE